MGLLDTLGGWLRRPRAAALEPVAALTDGLKADSLPAKADGCCDPGLADLYGTLSLSRAAVELLYESSKLAARIVDLLPQDMTRLPLLIDAGIFDGKKISEAVDAAHGRALAQHAMIYMRLFGGGGLLAFVEDGRETWEPVDFSNITRVAGLAPMHRYELVVQSWDNRVDSVVAGLPNFNQPLTFWVQPVDAFGAKMPDGRAVAGVWHRSRVIPWNNIPTLPRHRRYHYQGWSPGELERIFGELSARVDGMQHIGNLLRSFGFDVVKIAGLRGQLTSVKGVTEVQNRLRHLSRSLQITSNGVRVVAIDAGSAQDGMPAENLEPMARPVAGVRDLADSQRDHLQEVSDYPRSVLYGWVNAGLGNGEALAEKQAYYDLVAAKQPAVYVPQMRQLVELLCAARNGPTGGIIPPTLRITCPSLWSTPEDVAAKIRESRARARKIDVDGGVVSAGEARTDKTLEVDYDLGDEPPAAKTDYGAGTLAAVAKIQEAHFAGGRPASASRAVIAAMLPGAAAAAANDIIPDLTEDAIDAPAGVGGQGPSPGPPPAPRPGFFTAKDLEQRHGVSPGFVVGLHARGLVRRQPGGRHGAWRYSESDLVAHLEGQPVVDAREPGLLGESPAAREVDALVDRIADSDMSVLIHGETGTGKEVVARALHDRSRRRRRPFVVVDCTKARTEGQLLHEIGRARGGTLFLDEIGETLAQAQLLRALDRRALAEADIRVVAATWRDLPAAIAAGRFREDLYFRLAVVVVEVPPLRARGDDILRLADGFVADARARISPAAREALLHHPWPGNVRELRNVIERAVALADGGVIEPVDLRLGEDLTTDAYPHEHAAPQHDPGAYTRVRSGKPLAPGVRPLYGVRPDGGTEVQSVRFAADRFTEAEARAWLKRHGFSDSQFEPALDAAGSGT